EIDVGDRRQDGASALSVDGLQGRVLRPAERFDQHRADEVIVLDDENVRHATLLLRLASMARAQSPGSCKTVSVSRFTVNGRLQVRSRGIGVAAGPRRAGG